MVPFRESKLTRLFQNYLLGKVCDLSRLYSHWYRAWTHALWKIISKANDVISSSLVDSSVLYWWVGGCRAMRWWSSMSINVHRTSTRLPMCSNSLQSPSRYAWQCPLENTMFPKYNTTTAVQITTAPLVSKIDSGLVGNRAETDVAAAEGILRLRTLSVPEIMSIGDTRLHPSYWQGTSLTCRTTGASKHKSDAHGETERTQNAIASCRGVRTHHRFISIYLSAVSHSHRMISCHVLDTELEKEYLCWIQERRILFVANRQIIQNYSHILGESEVWSRTSELRWRSKCKSSSLNFIKTTRRASMNRPPLLKRSMLNALSALNVI